MSGAAAGAYGHGMARRITLLIVAVALVLLAPAASFASLADEQTQGRQLVAHVHSGAVSCKALSAEQLDHIGEYVMGRALGSTTAHQAMNDRMTLMMGGAAESRMHQVLGARYVGCSSAAVAGGSGSGAGPGMMMGGGAMMGGYSGQGGWNSMMSSSSYRWMNDGNWQHMSRADWQHLQRQWLGTAMPAGRHHMDSAVTAAIIIAVAVLLAAIVLLVGLRLRPGRRPPAASASA